MKILIVAGGTGGHLYPGVALARALTGHDITFVVRRGDLGKPILEKEGFAYREISGQGLPRSLSLQAISFPFNFLRGWAESLRLLRDIRPDRVVGMGGYLSIPVLMTAHVLGIRTMLHEQNALPGLANRFLSHWCDSVAISFPASQSYFPKKKVWISGLPIRPDIGSVDRPTALQLFGLHAQMPTVLVFGGSLGAQKLNTLCVEAWPLLANKNLKFQVIHITGMKDYERVLTLYQPLSLSAKVMPYCHSMAAAYAAADAIISRAGASTIAQLLVVQCPALLVPYPFASNNHQVYNAKVIESQKQGRVILDKALTAQLIADFVGETLAVERTPRSRESAPNAAQRLATHLL